MEIRSTRLTGVSYLPLVLVLVLSPGAMCCPHGCQCEASKVNCTMVTTLEKVGASLPPDTQTLHITKAWFETITMADLENTPANSLTTLVIRASYLKEVQDNAFHKLQELTMLDLSHNRIEHVGRLAFASLGKLQKLDLSHNAIQHLASPDILAPLTEVLQVDLENNQISDFPSGFFASQTHMLELNIGYNTLQNLKGSAFQGVRNLRKLSTPSCNIQNMENDLFKSLRSIDTFDLSFNQLKFLPSNGEFSQLINLRNLNIQGNQLVTLSDNQFEGLNLNRLDLSHNAITTVTNNTFLHMQGLRYLDISHNKLTSLPSFFLQPVSGSLAGLKLNSNPHLTSLPPTVFDGLGKLMQLNLSSCGILEHHERHYEQLAGLQHVDVSANQLTSLPASFFTMASRPAIQYVRLNLNQWYCDCRVKPFREWLLDPQTPPKLFCQDEDLISFRVPCPMPSCTTPARLLDSPIAMLTDSVLDECDNVGTNSASGNAGILIGVIAAIVFMLIVVVVVIILCLYRRHRQGKRIPCATNGGDVELRQQNNHGNIVKNPNKPLLHPKYSQKQKQKESKHFREKKMKRSIDPENASLNESDKDFIVRNYFSSMTPDDDGMEEDGVSDVTQTMTRKSSMESLSQSGYGYNSRRGSQDSSQYSQNAGCKFESAV